MSEVAWPSRREWTRLGILYALAALVYAAYALLRHARFESSGFDLGIFDHSIWRWSQFLSPENTVRRVPNLLGDHFHPVLLLLVPVRWLGFDARGLLFVQPFVAGAAAFPLLAFARRRLPELPSLGIALAYLASWGLAMAMAFDVHEFAFTALALALAVDAYDRRAGWPFLAGIAFWLLTKEDQGLAVAGLGLVALAQRRWGMAAALVAVGAGWLLLTTRVIIPHLAGGAYGHWRYGHLAPTPSGVLLFAMTHPVAFARAAFLPFAKTRTLLSLFGGYAFAPLLSPYALLIVLPGLSYLLSDAADMWEGGNHYWLPVSAAAAFAAADGLGRLLAKRDDKLPTAVLLAPLAASVLVSFFLARVPQRNLWRPSAWRLPPSSADGAAILALIPPDASVSATNYALPHLTGRESVYISRYGLSFGEQYPPLRARYVVIDPRSRELAGGREPGHPFRDPEYGLVAARGGWALYRLRPEIPDARGFRPIPVGTDRFRMGMVFDDRALP